jgi:hypothetical protein
MRMTQAMSIKIESKKNCENIHSGQFMISQIEQEEIDEYDNQNPDDDDECEEIISEASTSKIIVHPGSSSNAMQLERYQAPERHYEIDSDLSQVFNTLNVTYK